MNQLRYIRAAGPQSAVERLEIFLPSHSGYIKYTLAHSVNEAIHADTWRIYNAVYTDADLTDRTVLTTHGEWECALRLTGRDDFSGGMAHGDERTKGLTVFVDGIVTDPSTLTEAVPFHCLTVVESSTLYDPADHAQAIADHGKEYRFEDGRLTVRQFVDWRVSESLSSCFLAMFPMSKEVADRFYTDRSWVPGPIVYGRKPGVTDTYTYGDHFGARFAVLQYPHKLAENTLLITDNGGLGYHKHYYFAAEDGCRVESGERWESTTVYELGYKA